MHFRLLLPVLLIAVCLSSTLPGQEVSEETKKYHQMLLRRPQAGLVYDRFYTAWLETGTPEELGAFLAKQTGSAADALILALFHEQQGQEPEALKAYQAALSKDAANATAWLARARLEARMLDFTAALASLAEAAKAKPSGQMARDIGQLRGRWLLRTGKPEEALKAWRELLAEHVDDEELTEEVIDLQLDEGLHAEAEAQMSALVSRTKDAYTKALRQLRLAEIQGRAGKKEEALKTMGGTLVGTGQGSWIESEVLTQIEAAFRKDENITGLGEHLAKLGAEHPQRVNLQRNQARVLAELGEKDKALALYAALLAKTPGERELRESYLEMLEKFERFKEGVEQTNVLLTQAPEDRELLIRLATLQQRANELPAAKATLEKFLALKSTTEFDHLRVARWHESFERTADATAAYAAMVQAFPASPAAREAQAHYLHRIGQKEPALAIWRELGKTGDVNQLIAVGQALMTRNESAEALELLQTRMAEFETNERFLGLLTNAALSARKDDEAAKWALARVRAITDLNLLDDPLRQVVTATEKEDRRAKMLADLQKLPAPTPQERILMATLLEEEGHTVEAEKALTAMPAEQALVAQSRLVSLLERRQDWLRALPEAEKLFGMPAGRTAGNAQRLASLAERNGKSDVAQKWLGEWKTLSPGAMQPWLDEARLLRLMGKTRESLALLRAAARKFEDDESVASALAAAYAELGQLADAERIYLTRFEETEDLQAKMSWVASLARMAEERGQLKALTEKFLERQRTNRADAGPWLALAEIYRVSEDTSGQERALREAMRLRQDDVTLATQVARLDLEMGRWQSAVETLQRVATRDKGQRTAQMIASIHIEYGDENLGYRQLYELAGGSKIDPDDAVTMAKSMTARQDWARAAAFLEPVVRAHPLDYRIGYLHAVSLEEDGRSDEARQHFVRLLTQKEERPGAKKSADPMMRNVSAYLKRIEKIMPPEAVEYMKSSYGGSSYMAYNYRTQNIRFSGMSNSKAVPEPQTLATLQAYARPHLSKLISELDTATAEAAWASAQAAGVSFTEILHVMKQDRYGQMSVSPDNIDPKKASDLVLVVSAMNYNADATLAEAAFERFKNSYPIVAVQAAQVMTRKQSGNWAKVLEEALTIAEKQVDTDVGYTYTFSQFIGGGQSMREGGSIDLPEPTRQKMLKLSIRALESKEPGGQGADTSAVPNVLNATRAQSAWDDFLSLLEREIKNFEKPVNRTTGQFWATRVTNRAARGDTTILKPLSFPTAQQLPPQLTAYFRYRDPYNPEPSELHAQEEAEAFAPVLPKLDKVSSPALRAILAFKAGDKTRAEKDITTRAAAADATLDDLLLAASWHGMNEQPVKAAEVLLRAVSLPMPAELRTAFDAALAHAVIEAKTSAKPEWQQPAQMALRRLRSARITNTQKDELIAAMSAVGLKDEADQWAKLATVAAPTSSSSSRSYSSGSSPNTTKLKQLINGKDDDATAREAITQLKKAVAYASQGNRSYATSQAKQILGLMSRAPLKEKVQAAFKPGANASASKQEEYADFLLLTGDNKLAQETLEKVLSTNASAHTARIKLCTLIAPKEPDRAVSLLADVPLRTYQTSNLGDSIMNLFTDSSTPFQTRMTLAGIYAKILATAPDKDGAVQGLEWLQDLPAVLGRQNYNSPRLPSLYSRGLDENEDEDDDRTAAADSPEALKRLEVHEQACQALMKHPAMSEEGFRRFAAVHLKEGKKAADLLPIARQILEQASAARKGTRSVSSLNRRNNSSTELTGAWAPSPEEFLVWDAWKTQRTSSIESEILPLATGALDKLRLDRLKKQIELWTCPEAEFAAKAKSYTSTQGNGSFENNAPLIWIIDRWEERDLPGTPLDELMAASVDGQSWSTPYALVHYLQTRARLRPEAAAEDFLGALLKKSLGTKTESWKNQMEAAVNAYYGNGSFGASTGYSLLSLVNQLKDKPATLGLALKIATLTGLSGNTQWSGQLGYALERAARTPEGALISLEAAGLFHEADKLQFSAPSKSAQARMLTSLGSNRTAAAKIAKKLAAHQPQTFGVELATAFCADPVAPALTAFLKRRAPDLAKMQEANRTALASLIKANIPGLAQGNSTDTELIKAVEPLMKVENANSAAFVEKWLATTNTKTIEEDDDDYETKLVDTVRALIFTDPAKARALYIKGCELIENRVASGRWEGETMWNGWTHRSGLLDRMKTSSSKPEILGFYMKLVHEDTSGYLSSDGWATTSFGSALNEVWRNAGGGGAMGRGIDAVLRRCSEVLGDTPTTLMPMAFFDFMGKLPQAQRVNALRYVAKLPATHPQAALGKELEHAARLYLANEPTLRATANVKNSLAELGGMEPAWAHFRARLKDQSLHSRLRHTLGHFVCYEAGTRIDPECARLSAAAGLESMKAKHAMHGYQYGWIIHGFNQLPADDAWKAAAVEHWDAWIARNNNGGLSKYNPADWPVDSILRMAARAGNEEWCRETIRRFHDETSTGASGITSLMLGGMPKLAAEHFATTWRSYFLTHITQLNYSPEITAQMEAFRKASPDAGTALLGEIYLSFLKDPPKPDQDEMKGFVNKEARMKALAQRFLQTQFADPEVRTACIETLCTDWAAAAIIVKAADEAAAATDFAALGTKENTWEHWQHLKPLQFSVGMQAAAGNLKPAIAAFDKALTTTCSQSYYHKSLVKEATFGVTSVAPWKWAREFESGQATSKTKELMPFLDHVIAKTPKNLRSEALADSVSLKWMIHLLHGEQAAFDQWQAKLDEPTRESIYSVIRDRWEIWGFLQRYSNSPKGARMKPEERARLIAAILSNTWAKQKYPATGTGIPNLINDLAQKVKVFKPEELALVAAQIAEALPRTGRTASEAADFLAAQGKAEPAVPLYALAFQHARKENPQDYSLAAGFLLKQAETLERINQKPEALKVLQSIEQARVGPGLKKQIELADKRLNTQPKK